MVRTRSMVGFGTLFLRFFLVQHGAPDARDLVQAVREDDRGRLRYTEQGVYAVV